ncbi:MAG: toll/interleukin-1 receptor domain-containing protein [Xanthobacteraceae bacterium]
MRTGKKIFVSYASEDREPAYRIGLRLGQCGFNVFFDRDKLAPGAQYDETIRREVLDADIFVFLVSKHSFQQGRYTLTELSFARQKWPNPAGHVLPVNISRPGKVPGEVSDLMSYLTAVSAFWPKGEVAAEVVGEVLRMVEKEPGVFSRFYDQYIGEYFKAGVGKSAVFTDAELDEVIIRRHTQEGGRISAGDLKEKLNSKSKLRDPTFLTVSGHFFPSALLSFGWWERVNKNLESDIKWKDPVLQRWLFTGFEQWAPSWDLNDWSDEKPFKLIGQIGEHDEADSIPVLIKSESKARDVRGQLGNRIVVNANVRGLLCHETHLKTLDKFDENDAEFLETIKEMTSAQYYLVLFDGDKSHKVEVLGEPVDFYSGYIWQCWAPKEWVPSDPYDTRLPGAYFLWEHTNLAQPDVIKYGVDSLQRKVHYLNKRLQEQLGLSGELVLLQHLMPEGRLCGDMGNSIKPAIPTEQFRNLFLSRDEPQAAA